MSNTSDNTIEVSRVVEDEKALVGKGLTVDRVYTKEGVHPYDEVEWERRDVSQNNWQTGETVFEQRGVEFPSSWSYNASTIVTTKYFRGALHTEARETSLRQVIDRVVKRYAAAARQYNYMDNENATIFEHELTWMLLHQVFSFNSPVWFNVGTNSPQQVSACFILAVEDSMDSILNWYKEEGFVFKGGSGAGLNLSKIRGSKEHLRTSGGMASGPVSFMRGADSSAGAIKSGGATRRAAKMVILDVDHPDIEEFIETKALEERKIKALRDAGFDMELGGKDITSVQFQNANNSIRVSDKFLQAVEDGTSFDLIARLDGSVIETVDARTLWRKIAQAAWECADPGLQYDDTINHWHTNSNTGKINGSNPCSEYLSLDNSSCNLASLNLMKFQNNDGSFDSETFVKATEIVITAMEVSIAFADFPTEAITKNTKDYRQLGIGYANLGALLMSSGLAYDSTEGRAYAAAITSLMTGVSYRRSAEIAGIVGPYAGYAQNKEPHIRVMEKHREAAKNLVEVFEGKQANFIGPDIVSGTKVAQPIAELALQEWNHGLYLGVENGWRNAQASVLAPTGTISFMMDCDTTGVEPDFALTKFKKLVGGGSMTIVNTQVHPALRRLGYQGETIEAIEDFIAQNGHVNNAPGLKPEHYSVFDCAVGDRAISPNGHIRMMAAVQPFVSGAISKTVNLPDTATVEDIEKTYFDGWKLGLKAIAVYRDKCKVGQPLSDGKAKKSSQADEEITPTERIVERIIERPARRKLPAKRRAENTSFLVGGAEGYLTVGLYEDGKVGEVFIKMSKQGSTLSGIMDAFSISISMGLQYGVPLEAYVAKFTNMRFEPSGMTEDVDVRMAQSLLDYIFRRIALDHLPLEVREGYGIYTTSERIQALNGENEITSVAQDEIFIEPHPRSESESGRSVRHTQSQSNVKTSRVSGDRLNQPREVTTNTDAPLCLTCGVKMRMAGSCFVCESCGNTSGCS